MRPKKNKNMKKIIWLISFIVTTQFVFGQVTTSNLSGIVTDNKKNPVEGVSVTLEHKPTGTIYRAISNKLGIYTFQSIRVGGPFTLTTKFVGFKSETMNEIYTTLGVTSNVDISLIDQNETLNQVVVSSVKSNTFSKSKNGPSQTFDSRTLRTVPVIGARTIQSITKYNSQSNGNSFGGQDARLNNFTVDGSVFNNGFGLGNSAEAGGRTNSSAISLDAIDQIQLNLAPYDIKQTGFVGASINAITRSGTNNVEGSVYFTTRDTSLIGNKIKLDDGRSITASRSYFKETIFGARVGFPIIKNKLFGFISVENQTNTFPGLSGGWVPTGSSQVGNVSRVLSTDLTKLRDYVKTNFGYDAGAFEGYSNENKSFKFLIKLDWNIDENNKLSVRYTHHNSSASNLISNSQSAGAGNRTNLATALSFYNGGYLLNDNTRSFVAELNSKLNNTLNNNLIIGYDKQIEDRALIDGSAVDDRSKWFPTIDIRDGAATSPTTYTSIGLDPFTPGNKLDYATFHITDNLVKQIDNHTLTFGVNFEKFQSNNLFIPASNGVYVFNSLAAFYAAADQSIANGGKPSTLQPTSFTYRYSALPGGGDPLQVLKSNKLDAYFQDEILVNQKLKITYGLRVGLISFENTAIENQLVSKLYWAGQSQYNTGKLPDDQLLWEPRISFNYDVFGNKDLQIRGGTGLFTGRPPYVFLSNQVGNNGVLTGIVSSGGFTAKPWDYFTPATASTVLPTVFDLAFTDPNFKFPQVLRSSLSVDKKLPYNLIASAEYILNNYYNSVNYSSASFNSAVVALLNGVDNRAVYGPGTSSTNNKNSATLNSANISSNNAIVLNNRSGAYNSTLTLKLEYPFKRGFYGFLAWTTSLSKDYMDAGSIASGSWTSAISSTNNNDLSLSNSSNLVSNRIAGVFSYTIDYGKDIMGATTISLGYVGRQGSPFSYRFGADINNDGISGNDLIFVPTTAQLGIMKFANITSGTTTLFTIQQQKDAFEAYINQDDYLKSRRGKYAERNAVELPFQHRFDLSITQDISKIIGLLKNTLQFRLDVLNVGNLINSEWGVSKFNPVSGQILRLSAAGTQANNWTPTYQLATYTRPGTTNQILLDKSFITSANASGDPGSGSTYQIQIGIRYNFGVKK